MNQFIELRKLTSKSNNPNEFQRLILEDYIKRDSKFKDHRIISKIEIIRNIELKKQYTEREIYRLFEFLGENTYLDRYIIEYILENIDDITKKTLEVVIRDTISKINYNDEKIYHIIDLCIECNLDILDKKDLKNILGKYKLDFDIVSLVIEYIENFKRDILGAKIYDLLECDYPESIKIQIITLIVRFHGMENMEKYLQNSKIITSDNKEFYKNYIGFLKGEFVFKSDRTSILQSMFYGDFEDSGKGNNGGLAILLKNLGDEISKDGRISNVFTITIIEELNKPFISFYGKKHVFIRMPIYLNRDRSDLFVKRELSIKRYTKNLLERLEIQPDIFHIRYLDNASKAVAELSKELCKKLVFTLAPDPHRSMSNDNGDIEKLGFNRLVEKLNKIKIGDELIYKSDAIVGIGNETVRDELEIYFPHFKEKEISKKVVMIGEGIKTKLSDREKINLNEFIDLNNMDSKFFEKPIILNVGRLSTQKGQVELLKAWKESKLFKTHNLLFIGGNLEKPNKEESEVIRFFQECEKNNPEIRDRFFHKGAMPNEEIRSLQMSIMKNELDCPHIYISSSKKEEFGIAILEAMSQGFLVFGPIEGGVKSYLTHGENGFLIRTENYRNIREDVERSLYNEGIDRDGFRKIQNNGKRSVEELFSIEEIGDEFLEFYLNLKGE